MFNSSIAIAIFWPIVFAILQFILNSLAESEKRDGDKKYRLWFLTGAGKYQKSPLALNQLRTEIRRDNKNELCEIDVLSSGFLETSFGIDLCIVAMSTDIVNLLTLISIQPSALTTALHQGALVIINWRDSCCSCNCQLL